MSTKSAGERGPSMRRNGFPGLASGGSENGISEDGSAPREAPRARLFILPRGPNVPGDGRTHRRVLEPGPGHRSGHARECRDKIDFLLD